MDTYQQFIYKRTYSRWLPHEQRRENWHESVNRYANFMVPRVPGEFVSEFNTAIDGIRSLNVMPSMRALWTAGKALEKNNVAAFNCVYHPISDIRTWAEMMLMLMNGCGVGFSVERQYINKLPEIPEDLKEHNGSIIFDDSKEGWAFGFYDIIKNMYDGKIYNYDLSNLRPAGARLKTFGGKSSGPEPLDQLLKFVIQVFKNAKGRKLNSLECHDICCYTANCVVSGGVRRSATISLSNLTDERLQAAKRGEFWRTHPFRALANNSVAYTEKPGAARFMREWVSLVESGSGERGIFNRESAEYIAMRSGRRSGGHEWGCNPCARFDMRLLTTEGYKRFDELCDTEFKAIDSNGYPVDSKVWYTGKKDTVEIMFEQSTPRPSMFFTSDHRFLLNDSTVKCAGDLNQGDRLMRHIIIKKEFDKNDFLAGFIQGDSSITELNSETKKGVTVFIGEKDGDIADMYNTEIGNWYSRYAAQIAIDYKLLAKILPERELPDDITTDFLSGLYSANGSVITTSRIALKTTCQTLADQLVDELNSILDIHAYITTNKSKLNKFSNGTYKCRESYDVNIGKYDDILKFAEHISFGQKYKQDALYELLNKRSPAVKTIKPSDKVDVYDFEIPSTHWGIVEGVITHNCSEIILRPYGLCNLSEVIVKPVDSLNDLKKKIEYATILGCLQATLTDFRDLRPEWQQNAEEERLLGVSLSGLADHRTLNHTSNTMKKWLKQMKEVAIETAEIWSDALNINMPTAITCIKPSGTVSQLCNCSSGLHPAFSPYYIRRVRVAATDNLAKYMIDAGVNHNPEVGQTPQNVNTWVFDFPRKSAKHSCLVEDVNALEQLEYWLAIQQNFCEHKPSCTIYVDDHEWMSVGAWVYDNWEWVSGISFLPKSDTVYQLMPYEEINSCKYDELRDSFPTLNFDDIVEADDMTIGAQEFACVAGSCDLI